MFFFRTCKQHRSDDCTNGRRRRSCLQNFSVGGIDPPASQRLYLTIFVAVKWIYIYFTNEHWIGECIFDRRIYRYSTMIERLNIKWIYLCNLNNSIDDFMDTLHFPVLPLHRYINQKSGNACSSREHIWNHISSFTKLWNSPFAESACMAATAWMRFGRIRTKARLV